MFLVRILTLLLCHCIVSGLSMSVNRLLNDQPSHVTDDHLSQKRHPYIREELYAAVEQLDLTIETDEERNTAEIPSIDIIEIESQGCDDVSDEVTLEYRLPNGRASYSELVVPLANTDDVEFFLFKSMVDAKVVDDSMEEEQTRSEDYRFKRIGHRLRNKWIAYDVSDAVKTPGDNTGRKLVVRLTGNTWFSNATDYTGNACSRLAEKPATLFLYQNFPDELGSQLRGGSESKVRRAARRSRSLSSRRPNSSECHVHQWTVNFQEIGIQWVIAPATFRANYCRGQCAEPAWKTMDLRDRSGSSHVTNHALLVIRAQETGGRNLPSPVCVPMAYESLNAIYLDREGVVRVATFNDMTVVSCACE